MVFVGFILIAAAITAGAGVVLANAEPAELVVFGQDVPAVGNEWQVFAAGAAVAAVFVIGMILTFAGAGRIARNRRDLRDLREEHEESLTTLEMEKRRLERELARVRQGKGGTPPPARPEKPAGGRPGPQVWPPHSGPAPGRGSAPMSGPASAPQHASAAQGASVKSQSPFFDRNE